MKRSLHLPEQLSAFRGSAYDLIPLHRPDAIGRNGRSMGKAPVGSKWRLMPPMTADDAQSHMRDEMGNVGVRLRAEHLVVDVDPRHFADGVDSLKQLQSDLNVSFDSYPCVETGGGGWHIYMLKPAELPIVTTLEAYPGVEFKTLGTQVVAPGSVHPETGNAYRWDALSLMLADVTAAPSILLDHVNRKADPYSGGVGGDLSPADLAELLPLLDPVEFADHDRWFRLMASCHHASRGEGRQEFIAWSVGDPAYGDHEDIIGRRWDSLSCEPEAGCITQATLFAFLRDTGHAEAVKRVTSREDFADVEEDDIPAQSRTTSLAERYVWIVDAERFVRRRDTKSFTAVQFRTLYADAWPEGDVLNAVWKGKLPIPKVESMAYLPMAGEFVTAPGGARTYNLWRDTRIEPKPGDVGVFLEHMAYLFPDETERSHAIDYLALLVQQPATKINFALLVRGRQGTGKSWIGALLEKMIGEPNVGRPSNSVVVEKYTDWQQGAQVAVIEELMANGRHEVANRLKPVITDAFLCIRPMYGKAFNIPNHLNLVAFTNHADALPIEAGDRRWLVLFSPATPADETYYQRLFDFLDGDGPAAVAYWLGEREIALNPKGVAPMTAGKVEMRDLSLGDAEQHLAELLEEGAYPFDFDLVRFEDVVEAVPERIARQTRGLRSRVTKWLKDEVGAVKHTRRTKQDGGHPSWSLWSIADHEQWDGKGATARLDAYARHRGFE